MSRSRLASLLQGLRCRYVGFGVRDSMIRGAGNQTWAQRRADVLPV